MAAIPLYHQQQLESSRVGVPAMDESGNMMSQSLLSNSQTLTNAALGAQGQAVGRAAGQATQDTGMAIQEIQQYQQQNAIDRKQAEAKQAALLKEQTAKLNAHETESYVHRYTLDATDVVDAINADQTIAPENRPQMVRQSLDNLRKQYTDKNVMNSDVAAGFAKGTDGQIESEYQKATTAVNSFRTQQLMDQQKVDQAQTVSKVNTVADWQNMMQVMQTPGQQNNMFGMYGPKTATEQLKMAKMGAERVAATLSDSGVNAPADIDKLRKSGIFDKYITPDQWRTIERDAVSSATYQDHIVTQKMDAQLASTQTSIRAMESKEPMMLANKQVNPAAFTAAYESRVKLAALKESLLKNPETKQNVRALSAVDSAIAKEEAIEEKAIFNPERIKHNARSDAAAERTAAAFERSNALQAPFADAQRRLNFQREETDKNQALTKAYKSDDAHAAQREAIAKYDSFQKIDIKKDPAGKFKAAKAASDYIETAHRKGFLTAPGIKGDDFYDTKSADLAATMGHIGDKKAGAYDDSLFKNINDVPPFYMKVANPMGDTKSEVSARKNWDAAIKYEIQAATKDLGHAPKTDAELAATRHNASMGLMAHPEFYRTKGVIK